MPYVLYIASTHTPPPLKPIRCARPHSMWCYLFPPFGGPGQKFTVPEAKPSTTKSTQHESLCKHGCIGCVQVRCMNSCVIWPVWTLVCLSESRSVFFKFLCFLGFGQWDHWIPKCGENNYRPYVHKVHVCSIHKHDCMQYCMFMLGTQSCLEYEKARLCITFLKMVHCVFPRNSLIRSAERELAVSLGLFTPLVSPCGQATLLK